MKKLPYRRQFLQLAVGTVALPALSRIARAQAYPSRPVTIVIPFAPGGVTDFLGRYFAGPEFSGLRHSIARMVEGYDAADSARASILALREEWMDGAHHVQARIVGGYGALISELFPTSARATAQNVLFNIGRGVGGFGPVVIGAIASAYSFETAISLLAALYVLDILAMWLLIPERCGAELT